MKRSKLLAVFMLINIFSVSSAWAEIYKWIDANGKAHFSDKAPENKAQKIQEVHIMSSKSKP